MKKITLLFRKSQTLVAQEDQISNLNGSVGKKRVYVYVYGPLIHIKNRFSFQKDKQKIHQSRVGSITKIGRISNVVNLFHK